MQTVKKFILITSCLFSTYSYAIQVSVQTKSQNVTAIGFKVNGKQHGGLGSHYQGKNMPKGMYEFGLRSGGKDIPCTNDRGKKRYKISHNKLVSVFLKNQHCLLKLK